MSVTPPPQPPPLKAQDFAAVSDWPGYYRAVVGKPPRETLVAALAAFDAEERGGARLAVDLGCGEGRDTLEMLRRGWRVLATDADPAAFEFLLPRVPPEHRARLDARVAGFRSTPIRGVHLVNASFSLPFCPAEQFDAVWRGIVAGLAPGGRFAGQVFGDRDEWVRYGHTIGMSRERLDEMLAAFEVESVNVEEKDDALATGEPKHWHVFHVVARKR